MRTAGLELTLEADLGGEIPTSCIGPSARAWVDAQGIGSLTSLRSVGSTDDPRGGPLPISSYPHAGCEAAIGPLPYRRIRDLR